MRRLTFLVTGLCLALALACGGGKTSASMAPPDAKGLAYTDPTATGWRLVKDPASTPTRLLLNLVGPSGLKTRGAGFNLKLPASIKAGNFAETGFPIKDLGVYELYNSTPWPWDPPTPMGSDPLEPRLLAGGVKPGNLLTVGDFQKDRRLTAKDSGQALLQIALEFDAAAGHKVGDVLPLTITKARHIPEDIGGDSLTPTPEEIRKFGLVNMSITIGTLSAQ